jgi:ABC-2 type transport system ATP-binding protein
MGLTLSEARRSLDAVMEFAELEEFLDLQLKNYSSGMLVRLAFAVMVQAQADVMLVDEVLAVGDAAFAQKCMDVFRDKRRAGTTIVLVTHDMTTVQTLCHRAMLLHEGELLFLGAPEDAALAYYRKNFADEEAQLPVAGAKTVDLNTRVVRAELAEETLAEGQPIVLDVVLEAARTMARPKFMLRFRNDEGQVVFELIRRVEREVTQGRRVTLAGPVENRLLPGRYTLDVVIREELESGDMIAQALRLLHFVVEGSNESEGVVSVSADVEAVLE